MVTGLRARYPWKTAVAKHDYRRQKWRQAEAFAEASKGKHCFRNSKSKEKSIIHFQGQDTRATSGAKAITVSESLWAPETDSWDHVG